MPVNILIAEDSPVQTRVLKHILEEQGYEVSTADNGILALEMAAAIKPALIISDVDMPEMNGYQLTAHIKSSPELQQTPVILVTSMSDPEDVIRGLNRSSSTPCRTTGPVLTWPLVTSCLAFLSACMATTNLKGPVSGWPLCTASSNTMAGGYGPKAKSMTAPFFHLPCLLEPVH